MCFFFHVTNRWPCFCTFFLLENLRCFSQKNIGHSTDNPEAMTRLQPLQQELSQLGFLCRERSSLELTAFFVTERMHRSNGGSPGMTRWHKYSPFHSPPKQRWAWKSMWVEWIFCSFEGLQVFGRFFQKLHIPSKLKDFCPILQLGSSHFAQSLQSLALAQFQHKASWVCAVWPAGGKIWCQKKTLFKIPIFLCRHLVGHQCLAKFIQGSFAEMGSVQLGSIWVHSQTKRKHTSRTTQYVVWWWWQRKCELFCILLSTVRIAGHIGPTSLPLEETSPWNATATDSRVFFADPPHRNLEPWLQLQSGPDWFWPALLGRLHTPSDLNPYIVR